MVTVYEEIMALSKEISHMASHVQPTKPSMQHVNLYLIHAILACADKVDNDDAQKILVDGKKIHEELKAITLN